MRDVKQANSLLSLHHLRTFARFGFEEIFCVGIIYDFLINWKIIPKIPM